MIFDLGNGKQIVIRRGRIMICANKGWLGVELTPEEQRKVGLALVLLAKK